MLANDDSTSITPEVGRLLTKIDAAEVADEPEQTGVSPPPPNFNSPTPAVTRESGKLDTGKKGD